MANRVDIEVNVETYSKILNNTFKVSVDNSIFFKKNISYISNLHVPFIANRIYFSICIEGVIYEFYNTKYDTNKDELKEIFTNLRNLFLKTSEKTD